MQEDTRAHTLGGEPYEPSWVNLSVLSVEDDGVTWWAIQWQVRDHTNKSYAARGQVEGWIPMGWVYAALTAGWARYAGQQQRGKRFLQAVLDTVLCELEQDSLTNEPF